MKFSRRRVFVTGFLGLLSSGLFAIAMAADAPAAPPTPPAKGDKATDFALKTLDNQEVKLSELTKTGPVVVVQLRGWVGYQCPICIRQVSDLSGHAKDLAAAGARVVLIYPGPADELKKHAEDFAGGKNLPAGFFFVLDPDMKFVNDWHLRWEKKGETAYPATFVVDKDGVITFAKVSKSHGDRATSAEVLKALTP